MRNATINNAVRNQEHPNILILKKLDTRNLAESANLFAKDFVWHCFNPKRPFIDGEYTGLKGFQGFLKKLETLTSRTFQIEPVSITTIGDELVVTYVKDKMTLENQAIEPDAIIIWRIVNDLITEAGISHMSIQSSYRKPI
ncbi:MAG: nuclear transport factor 2 family protein [Pleurocapsa sp.]